MRRRRTRRFGRLKWIEITRIRIRRRRTRRRFGAMSSLIFPEEIIEEILSWLPVKPIMRFRCVCKTWCKLLRSNNSDFVEKHLNHNIENNNVSIVLSHENSLYTIDYCDYLLSSSSLFDNVAVVEEFDNFPMKSWECCYSVLGSCNGLLCIHDVDCGEYFEGTVISIWNPSTNEYKLTPSQPPPVIVPEDEYHLVWFSYGFGYDSKIKDYKLVRIESIRSVDFSEVSIITLGSSTSWERIQSIPYNHFVGLSHGLFVNGALHWLASSSCIESGKVSYVIVIFDVGDDRFREMPLPICLNPYNFRTSLDLLGGSICLYQEDRDKRCFDVWVMKDYGVIESWTKLFTIQKGLGMSSYVSPPILSFKNGEILLAAEASADLCTFGLISYDPKHKRCTTLNKISGLPPLFCTMTYVRSLVPLNSGTYVERSGAK